MPSDAVHRPADHPAVQYGKVGVLLINLGTPDATDYWSVRRYLKEFLSDRRVVELPPLLWKPILYGPILTFRPSKSGHAYKAIWCEDSNESPLRKFTRSQSELLQTALAQRGIMVDWAMRYGQPSIADKLNGLKDQGCDRILLCALYPQYSASTTATAHDKAFDALKAMRWQPALRTLPPYHDDPIYIDALARSIEQYEASLDWQPEVTLLSFHGLPKRYLLAGDPYHCHCVKTGRLLREHMGRSNTTMPLSFQSRFGKAEWLQPYTEPTIRELAQRGVKNLTVVTPGFVSDCVETLEEIGLQAREVFLQAGGEHFAVVPCLNDSPLGIGVLHYLIERELQGWLT
ncbi:MAG: ferrochelatase [Candidatus Competibacteraceae bacterium]|nr:ferrochelatase [Candidatus Competibacteraceae bacterium]